MKPDPAVGLCSICRFGKLQKSSKGSHFWRCLRADRDASYLRYAPLPVHACPGHEEGDPASDTRPYPDGG